MAHRPICTFWKFSSGGKSITVVALIIKAAAPIGPWPRG
jgi:hypothetical protein